MKFIHNQNKQQLVVAQTPYKKDISKHIKNTWTWMCNAEQQQNNDEVEIL